MAEGITRLPTKFGQGHTDIIAMFQDVVMPALIKNELACFVFKGIMADGTEIDIQVHDCAPARTRRLQMLGLIAELQAQLALQVNL